ncbi:sensor histidine kinase [Maribacter sp. MAR_2009_72]|uniref:sensor histidine kinase n=1 Tax=Maribacter sp. MAR_2009_72 TaxID=1250050 RepID=UPI0016473043|nr:sensor histidine kinase [Maribacter sp. MAR_2009_72]
MKSIINGYLYQYQKSPKILQAYNSFSKAKSIADETGNKLLVKLALTSILNLIKAEIFIGSKQYEPYLNHLKEINDDNVDAFRILLLETIFKSKANDQLEIDFNYGKTVKKMDSMVSLLPIKHPFLNYYHFEKGIQFKLSGEFTKAELYFKKVDSATKGKLFWQDYNSTNLWQLASLKLDQKNFVQAKNYLQRYNKTAKTLKDKFFYNRLNSWILEEEGRYDSAYYYLNLSIENEYKIGAKNNSLETALLSIENQTDKLKLDKVVSENKQKTTQNWLIAASFTLLFGLGFAILLQKNTTKKRLLAEQETQLKQERVDNLLKQQELVSIDAMIEGQEKERQRVANELHDDLGSLMATIKLHFNTVNNKYEDPALHKAETLLEEAYQKVRGMAHSKNSGVMSDQGLLPAIRKMAQVISETNALQVSVEDFGMGDRLENSLELSLFRTVQELVANAIKHAEATTLNIQLTQHEDTLNIIVEDNGKGFDRTNAVKGKNGMGLTNIEKRIEHLEGHFTIDSVLGKGTSILIDIPI